MKKFVAILILSCAALPVYADSYANCKALYDDGKYGAAATCFDGRVRSNPNDIQSNIWYAASLYYDKQYTKSYQQYSYIAQKYPNTPSGKYALNEAQKVKNKIQDVNNKKANDKGDYISELDYTSKWTSMPIRVWIQPSAYEPSVKKAFNLWQTQTGGVVKFTYVSNQSTANIKIKFVDKITNPITNDQLGKTNLQFSGKKNYSANIELLQRTKSNQLCSQKQIYYTSLHEIGHALGVSGHSKNNNDVMYFNTNTNSLGLSNRDINTVRAIYK